MQQDRPETEGERLERERVEEREREARTPTESWREEAERINTRNEESGLGPPDPGHN